MISILLSAIPWLLIALAGVFLMGWGADAFADNLATVSVRLGVSSFALALLLAGAEPEELITSVVSAAHRAPAIAFGDVLGTNIFICLGVLGLASLFAPLRFSRKTYRVGLVGLLAAIPGAWIMWHGRVTRPDGALLAVVYAAYVGGLWIVDRRPPALGESHEVEKARKRGSRSAGKNREVLTLAAGVVAMSAGGVLLVEAITRISKVQAVQDRYSLTLVGFATGFEFLALAWATGRRGQTETLIAAVFGSFVYNMTMTIGAGGLVRPLLLAGAGTMRMPVLFTLGALLFILLLALPRMEIRRTAGAVMVLAYASFIAVVLR